MACMHFIGQWRALARHAFLAVAFILVRPLAARAAGVVTERTWYEDRTGTLDWAAVRTRPFEPFNGVLTGGFGKSPLWIRLRIDPGAAGQAAGDPNEPLILRVLPTVLDHVELFDPLDVRSTPRVSGDMHPWSQGEYPSLSLAFRIPRGEHPRDVWLRIQSEGTRRVQVDVAGLEDTWRIDNRQNIAFSLLLGVMMLFLGFALIYWIMAPELLLTVFAAKQLFGLLFALAYMGHLRMLLDGWVPGPWVNQISVGLLFMLVLTGAWFEVLFLSELKPKLWIRRLMWGFLATIPTLALLMLLGWVQLALNLLFFMLILLPLLGLVIVLMIRYPRPAQTGLHPLLPKAVLVSTYFARAVLMLLSVLPALGLFETTDLPFTLAMLQHVLAGLVVVAMLQLRARRQFRARARSVTQLAIARDHTLQERAHREEQQKLLAMLAHELKTPLAAMKMLVSLRNPPPDAPNTLHRMLADMNNVIERCLQSVRIQEPALVVHEQDIDVALKLRLALTRVAHPERIEVICPAGLRWNTDPQVLQMVVGNLLDNALKYSPSGSPVVLSAERMDGPTGALRLWVENEEGHAGVPDPAHVFEKYYRNPLARRHSGSGLGLYLTRVFVKALGGSIRCVVSSRRVRFELCLPS